MKHRNLIFHLSLRYYFPTVIIIKIKHIYKDIKCRKQKSIESNFKEK